MILWVKGFEELCIRAADNFSQTLQRAGIFLLSTIPHIPGCKFKCSPALHTWKAIRSLAHLTVTVHGAEPSHCSFDPFGVDSVSRPLAPSLPPGVSAQDQEGSVPGALCVHVSQLSPVPSSSVALAGLKWGTEGPVTNVLFSYLL